MDILSMYNDTVEINCEGCGMGTDHVYSKIES